MAMLAFEKRRALPARRAGEAFGLSHKLVKYDTSSEFVIQSYVVALFSGGLARLYDRHVVVEQGFADNARLEFDVADGFNRRYFRGRADHEALIEVF